MKRFLAKCSSLLTGIADSNRLSFAFMICLLAITLVYRIQLTMDLFTNKVKPFDFNPTSPPIWFTVASLPYDLAFVSVCFLLSWLLSRMTSSSRQSRTSTVSRIPGLFLIHIVLMILILIHGIHGRLLFNVQTGFDTSVIKEAFSGISFVETSKLVELRDYLFLLFPFGLFWLVFLSPARFRIWIGRASVVWVILLLSLSLLVTRGKAKNVPDEIRLNPTLLIGRAHV